MISPALENSLSPGSAKYIEDVLAQIIEAIISIFFEGIDTKWVASEYRSIDPAVSIRPSLLYTLTKYIK